jgi:hypothetical protein
MARLPDPDCGANAAAPQRRCMGKQVMHAHHRIPGASLAVLLAGPIFSASLAVAIAAEKLPGPVAFTEAEVRSYIAITLC